MILTDILKRKDAASVVVAVVAALVIATYLTTVLTPLSSWILGLQGYPSNQGFRLGFLQPTLLFVLQFFGFELLVRTYLKVVEKRP